MIITTGRPLPAPLAEDAAIAERHAGNCSLCRHPIIAFDRYATLVPSGQLAHVRCVSLAALRRVPSIW